MKNLCIFIGLIFSTLCLLGQSSHPDVTSKFVSNVHLNTSSKPYYLVPITSSPTDMKFTISGIYSQDKIENIKINLKNLLNATNDLVNLSSLSINIESSGKIAVFPQGKIDEAIIDNIRNYLSTYDWDYLHEIMTVDILIHFRKKQI